MFKYSLGEIWMGIRNPYLMARAMKKEALRFNGRVSMIGQTPCHVLEEDWDNLLILDACRYDMFKSQELLDGDLKYRISAGSNSVEFLETNFEGREAHDTVYISANPHTINLPDGTFHRLVNLFATDWDESLETVRPSTVVDATLDAYEQTPNKRLVAHFMQPHYPFIGELGKEIDHRGFSEESVEGKSEEKNVWQLLETGELNRNRVWEAYCENLDIVLEHVEDLLESLPGKTVITADHGNLVGERTYPLPVRGTIILTVCMSRNW